MNRRKFLKWLGFGAAVVAAPAVAALPEAETSGRALMAKYFPGPTIGEAMADQWTEGQLAMMRAQCQSPLVFNIAMDFEEW